MDEATAARVFFTFNICEGILWLAFAAGFAVVFLRRRQRLGLMLAGGLLFLSFGLSDFVETQTGGWYKPWWMLAWKGVTLAGLLTVCVKLGKAPPGSQ